MARDWEERVAEYVDSARMRRRLKLGTLICCTIDGHYGAYVTRADLAEPSEESCTCPVGEGVAGCKHTEALRRTYRERPRSFANVDEIIIRLAKKDKADLLVLVREMIIRAPATLGVLGVRGFDDEREESYNDLR